jgi:hypothetical protein
VKGGFHLPDVYVQNVLGGFNHLGPRHVRVPDTSAHGKVGFGLIDFRF